MSEPKELKVVTFERMYIDFSTARETILENFTEAKARIYGMADWSLAREHLARTESLTGLTLGVFSGILRELGGYKEIVPQAYDFLKDDLDRAVKTSQLIANNPTSREFADQFRAKLDEIKEKIEKFLVEKK